MPQITRSALRAKPPGYTLAYRVSILLGVLFSSGAMSVWAVESTLYVNRYFEVHDHDQPTKYIFRGETRVARVTGSLSSNTRLQRLRLEPGWNLCSLAVTATNAWQQMTNSQPSILTPQSVFRWNAPTVSWVSVASNDTLTAGTVLWLHATTNATLALTGTYTDPTNRPIASGASFQSGTGLEALPLLGERAGVRADVALANYDSDSQLWQLHDASIPFVDPGFPRSLAPGAALFMNADTPATLAVPESALRVRYYHQDHLGSSSVMTDADGVLVEETAFYPSGFPRSEHRVRLIEEEYKFTQKEHDKESGLHYFEARYLASHLNRFCSVDPALSNQRFENSAAESSHFSDPQRLNYYTYAGNNPLRFVDATGEDVSPPPAARKADPLRLPGGVQIRLANEDMAGPRIVRDLWTSYYRNVADPTIYHNDWSEWKSSNPQYVRDATSRPTPGQFTALFLGYEGNTDRNTEWTSVTPKVSIRTFYSSPEAQKDPVTRAAAAARTAQIVDYLNKHPLPKFKNIDRPGDNHFDSAQSLQVYSEQQNVYEAKMYQSFETPKSEKAE